MFSPMQAAGVPPTSTPINPTSPADSNPNPYHTQIPVSLEKASQSSPHGTHGLNARSCVTCRRRKVKCDKSDPCSNCTRAGSPCVFPAPGRAPRRPRRGVKVVSGREAELLKRLRRLEGVVEELSSQVEIEAVKQYPSSDNSSSAHRGPEPSDTVNRQETAVQITGMDEGNGFRGKWLTRSLRPGGGPPKTSFGVEEINRGVGRLVMEEGKSRYVASPFWASVSEEVEEIRDMLNDHESDSDSDTPAVPTSILTETDHQSFIMGYSSSDVSLKDLHPLPSQIPFYWQTFLDNVNPLVKIMHTPTMNKIIKDVQNNLDSLSKSTEALMFSIYFATVTSMTANEVLTSFGVRKEAMLKQYRFGVEQALAKAGFLNTNEIVTVQAFVLFLLCVRRHDDTRFVWSLTGLALRIAQSLGLHRDGTAFGLSPFDTEMRRRLWWQVCILDSRASEDHGSDLSILDNSFDTQYPLNINDDDLDPDATEPPIPRLEVSEMTFCLIRFEICNLTRSITYIPPGGPPCVLANGQKFTIEEKEQIIRDKAEHLEKTYLQYCEDAGPLYWVAATVARLVIAKLSLIIYHPLTQPGKPNSLSQDIRDRLFMTSIEMIEYSHVLQSEASTQQWGWLFHTYIQWHAVAYILGELCLRSNSAIVDRAWAAVNYVFREWSPALNPTSHSKTGGMLWQPMRKLMTKARRRRAENLQSANNDTDNNGLGIPSKYIRPPPEAYSRRGVLFPCNIAQDRQRDQQNALVSGNVPAPSLTDRVTSTTFYDGVASFMAPQIVGEPNLLPDQTSLQSMQNQSWLQDTGLGNTVNSDTANTVFDPYFPGADAGLVDMEIEDMGDVNWEVWDELVRDYQMEQDQAAPEAVGPSLGGMGQW